MSGPAAVATFDGVLIPASRCTAVARGLELLQAELRQKGLPPWLELEHDRALAASVARWHASQPKDPQVPPGTASTLALSVARGKHAGTGRTMTTSEVTALSGLSGRWVRALAVRGELRGHRSPDGWRFREHEVYAWLQSRKTH
jgi:excisionase family DNA binding protein